MPLASLMARLGRGTRTLFKGIILLTLTLPANERILMTARELLSSTDLRLVQAVKALHPPGKGKRGEDYFTANDHAVETLLRVMARCGDWFGGIRRPVFAF